MFKKIVIAASFFFTFLVGARAEQMPAPHVDVFEISGFQPYTFETTYPAKVKAFNVATVVAKVAGTITNQYVDEGKYVNKGETLFKIDDEVYKSDVEVLKSQLEIAKIQMKKAEADFERINKSFQENVVSKQDYDNARFALEQAKANIALIENQLKKSEINLKYTNITATEGGFAGIKLIDIGDYVLPGTPVIELTDSTKVYVEFSLPDNDYTKIKSALNDFSKTELFIENNENIKGKITFIDSKMDPDTVTVKVRATFENKNNSLIPGMFTRIRIKTVTGENLIKIPQKAVLQNPMGTICFVVENDTVAVRPLQIAESKEDFYFVKGPFKSGEKIILNNFFKIKPGAKVVIDKIIKEEK